MKMPAYNIAVIEGDGIGPDLMREGRKVLAAVQDVSDLRFEFVDAPAGGRCYERTGSVLPNETVDTCRSSHAVYKAPVGLPDLPQGLVEQGLILPLRQELDAYANIRPVVLYDELRSVSPLRPEKIGDGIDFVVIRENSEGLYSKLGGKRGGVEHRDEMVRRLLEDLMEATGAAAIDVNKYSEKGVDRIIRFAFDYAKSHGRTKVTSVDKANVLYASQFWREMFNKIAKKHPDLKTESLYVDAFSQYMLRWPSSYQIVVTDNMFGDILTDEGAEITGSLGMGGSANVNPNGVSIFEPIHGSAPDIAGKGIANPIGMILAGKMMLEILGHYNEAGIVEKAIVRALQEGYRTKDISLDGTYCSTEEMGSAIAENIRRSR